MRHAAFVFFDNGSTLRVLMSYATYTTKAIICGSRDSNTSDKSYLLFTEELGMLWASAKSVRFEKSKQRCALQDFSLIRISLIQGKATWRIGSVEELSNPFLAASSRTGRGGVSFIIKTIRRYVHGEVVLPRTFSDTVESLTAVSLTTDTHDVEVYQQMFVFRLLSELGYVATHKEYAQVLSTPTIGGAVVLYDSSLDAYITKSIEHASQVSHL